MRTLRFAAALLAVASFGLAALPAASTIPIAKPRISQPAVFGRTVTLDASSSTEPQGSTLTFEWSIVSEPSGCHADFKEPTAINPQLSLDCAGTYEAQLIVTNAAGVSSPPALLELSTSSSLPVAKATETHSIDAGSDGSPVLLDGARSTSPDGTALRYLWSMISAPAGSSASIVNAESVLASFVPDRPGKYVAELAVRSQDNHKATSQVTLTTGVMPIVADAGMPRKALPGASVQLDGSRSTDLSGGPLRYQWAFLAVPLGSQAKFNRNDFVDPTFTTDREGTYLAQLTVCNATRCADPATTVISTAPITPLADAGAMQKVAPGTGVTLDASRSVSPNDSSLNYSWSFNTKPAGSTAVLGNASTEAPSFLADSPGIYVAQVTVTDASGFAASSTVTISTDCLAPLADPGETQSLNIGKGVIMQGGKSSSLCGEELTYGWSLLSTPEGSNAALSGATSSSPAFTPDGSGTYVAQLIVRDGSRTSEPMTVKMTTMSGPSLMLPVSITMDPSYYVTYPVQLSTPAPAGGLTVILGVSDPSIATFSSSTAEIPAGGTVPAETLTLTPHKTGTVTITATADGYSSATETATVAYLSSFNPNFLTLQTGKSSQVQFYDVPSNHSFTLSSSDSSVVSVPAVLPAGSFSFTATAGQKAGSATVTLTGAGIAPVQLPVTVTTQSPIPIGCDGVSVIGFNQTTSCGFHVSASGTATVTSSDATKLLVTGNPSAVGSGSVTVPLSGPGSGFSLQALASSGTVNITVSAPGFASSTLTFSLVPSFFGFDTASNPVTIALGQGTQTFVLSLQAQGQELSSLPMRPGITQTVNIASSNPAVGTAAGAASVSLSNPAVFGAIGKATFTPLAAGTTTLTIVQPSGYGSGLSINAYPAETITVTGLEIITNCTGTLGYQLQEQCYLYLPAGFQHPNGVTTTITSSSPNLLVGDYGSYSQTYTDYYTGSGVSAGFDLVNTGAGSGSATLTLSTKGFSDETITIPFGPDYVSFTNDLSSNNAPITLATGNQGDITITLNGSLGPGYSLSAGVVSSNPAVVSVSKPVTISNNGAPTAVVSYKTISPGTAVLSPVLPANFVADPNSQLTITVTPAHTFSLNCNGLYLGSNLEAPCQVTLSQPAPTSGVTVGVLVNGYQLGDSGVPFGISESATFLKAGEVVNLSFAPGTTTQTVWLQNLTTASETWTITASADGYSAVTATIYLVPSGFSFGQATTATSLSKGPVVYPIYANALVGGKAGPQQWLLPGVQASLYVANLRSSVGNPKNPVIFVGGTSSTSVTFTPVAAGTDVMCITQPAGYKESTNLNEITITVTAP